jgi:PTH1 family peptidyl-tRNA hydrolase
VDALCRVCSQAFRSEARFHSDTARCVLDDSECWLQKPMTFMNRSGQAVGALARFYRIPLEQMLVVHDDLDLSPGTIRLKRGGGHGGHNGLRDLMSHLGGGDFNRLRVGIGHPGHRDQVVEYVLHRPSVYDRRQIEEAIQAALEAVPDIVAGRFERAMNLLHAKPKL